MKTTNMKFQIKNSEIRACSIVKKLTLLQLREHIHSLHLSNT